MEFSARVITQHPRMCNIQVLVVQSVIGGENCCADRGGVALARSRCFRVSQANPKPTNRALVIRNCFDHHQSYEATKFPGTLGSCLSVDAIQSPVKPGRRQNRVMTLQRSGSSANSKEVFMGSSRVTFGYSGSTARSPVTVESWYKGIALCPEGLQAVPEPNKYS
jgi:hypothetical protein